MSMLFLVSHTCSLFIKYTFSVHCFVLKEFFHNGIHTLTSAIQCTILILSPDIFSLPQAWFLLYSCHPPSPSATLFTLCKFFLSIYQRHTALVLVVSSYSTFPLFTFTSSGHSFQHTLATLLSLLPHPLRCVLIIVKCQGRALIRQRDRRDT